MVKILITINGDFSAFLSAEDMAHGTIRMGLSYW
jgi:hypothetical protein